MGNRVKLAFPEQMYNAIASAETGGEQNPYIRTKVRPPKGSTAFGPVQLTGTTAEDFVTRNQVSPEAAAFYRSRMQPIYKNFAYYGNEPNKPGYDKKWEYGGTGGFDPNVDAQGYKRLATDVMSSLWNKAGGNPERFIQLWRGEDRGADPRYFNNVMSHFKGMQ